VEEEEGGRGRLFDGDRTPNDDDNDWDHQLSLHPLSLAARSMSLAGPCFDSYTSSRVPLDRPTCRVLWSAADPFPSVSPLVVTKKRRNGGRNKNGRGHVVGVRCSNCSRMCPKVRLYRNFIELASGMEHEAVGEWRANVSFNRTRPSAVSPSAT
jgi:hypothetical protein